jgi:putative endonuclease
VRDAPPGASQFFLNLSQSDNILSMKFHYVYVLKSLKLDWLYVGSTSDLKQRYRSHNNKENLSTKGYAPFNLIFYEAYLNKKDALRREEYFKTTKGKTTLKTMLREYFSHS